MKTSFSSRASIRIALAIAIPLAALLLVSGSLHALRLGDFSASFESARAEAQVAPSLLQAAQVISYNVDLVAQLGGLMNNVAVQGNTAYVGVGPSLVILDVADPAHLTVLGQSRPMPGTVYEVVVSGTYAYIADYSGGLRVMDVSDPASPHEIGSYTAPVFRSYCVAVQGNYAYVGGLRDMRIIDISNPTGPQWVSTFETPRTPFALAVAGQYAYIGVDRKGLFVVDVSVPVNPRQVGSVSGNPFDVIVQDHYVYVADYYSGFKIYDIITPTTLSWVGSFHTPGPSFGVAVAGAYAYVADWYGLSVIDISEPITPTQTGYYSMTGAVEHVAASGDIAFAVARGNGLHAINVSDPANPHEVGFYETPFVSPASVAVAGAFAYVTEDDLYGYGPMGMRIVNISDPLHPFRVSSLNTPGRARDIAVAGPYAYIADDNAGLRVINVLYATSPVEISSVDTPGQALGVEVSGNYAYVADGPGGLRIVKVKDPADPDEVSSYDTPGNAQDVAIAGSLAYVADGSAGLRILNVANLAQPAEIGFYDTPGDAQAVAVSGNYAYVADGNAGLRIVNVSNPANPVEVSYVSMTDSASDVTVAPDGLVYVATRYNGVLRVINVADPARPVETGFYKTVGDSGGVAVSNGLAYLASGDSGLMILHYHPGPPMASFTADPTSGQHPLTVVFTDTSMGGVDSWLWAFGDGATSVISNPTHTYMAAGVYTVSLRVSNVNGSDALTRANYITATGAAAFTAEPTFGRPPLTVTFTNQSTGSYTSSLWDFGDGITSTLTNPTHTYWVKGAYTVALAISGPDGDDTEIKPALIAVIEPAAYLPLVMRNYSSTTNLRFVAPGGTDTGNDCGNSARPCATAQRAVDAAGPGNEIRVAAGTYTAVTVRPRLDITTTGVVTQVVYINKTVTIRGGYSTADWNTSNPTVNPTILDAQGQGRVLYITGDISPTLESLRITGGTSAGAGGYCGSTSCFDAGGGVYIMTATATLNDCQIYGNTAGQFGAGVHLAYSAARLTGNRIYSNVAQFDGAGVSLISSTATLSGNEIVSNTGYSGSGVYLSGSSAMLSGNVIQNNVSEFTGGGVYLTESNATLRDNTIARNVTGYRGGGAYLYKSAATLSSNLILSNTASGQHSTGGGLYLVYSPATLRGNSILSNTVTDWGGGVHLDSSSATLISNTLGGNTAYVGGGAYLGQFSDGTLTGNIIVGNAAGIGGGVLLANNIATLHGNTILSNTATQYGGGAHLSDSDATLSGNIISHNAAQTGGGLSLNRSNAVLINNVIADNQAVSGSGMIVSASRPHLVHTTIARNVALDGSDDGGIYVTRADYGWDASTLMLTNTILVSHTVGISVTGGNTVTVNGILWFGAPITVSQAASATVTMQNQVEGDPAFAADGYHLTAGSAAIDRGVDAGVLTDIDGVPRPQGTLPDLGAVEYFSSGTLPLPPPGSTRVGAGGSDAT